MVITSDPESTDRSKDQTPRRLLDAAARLWAEKGYAATSVRDITAAADCNVAAINYYFGNKQGLYEHVFKEILSSLREQRISAVSQVLDEAVIGKDIERVLRAFADSFLKPLMDQERGQVMIRLFNREMSDPQLPPSMFIQEMVEPIQQMMVRAMQSIYPGMAADAATMCLHSLVAQLIHLVQTRQFFAEAGRVNTVMADLDRLVEHIVQFSAAGVRMYEKDSR